MGKNNILLFALVLMGFTGVTTSVAQLPDGFVYVKDHIPDIEVELRYFTSNNFIGRPIDGYNANRLIFSAEATKALKKVQEELRNQNLCLKVYDAYRPQRAVNDFVAWSKDLGDTLQKQEFYPEVEKQFLFREGYIASKSGHSRGSTIDLTVMDGNTGEVLDMGGFFDFFGEQSWLDYTDLTEAQLQNRQLLQDVMLKHNFRNYPKEWWHFTLRWEPFQETYFDFVVE